MKILHICESDINGGASTAAYRLHKGLLNYGVESKMLVAHKLTNDDSVFVYKPSWADTFFHLIIKRIENKIVRSCGFGPGGHYIKYTGRFRGLLDKSKFWKNFDIVHIHFISRHILSIKGVSKIQKPIVWSPHDLWCLSTGYSYYYQDGLNAWKRSEVLKNQESKLEKYLYDYRLASWIKKNFYLIAQSQFTYKLALSCEWFKSNNIIEIPFYIDTKEWFFDDSLRNIERSKLGYKDTDIICSFGATNINKVSVKNLDFLKKVVSSFVNKSVDVNIKFVCFGNSKSDESLDALGVKQLGKLSQNQVHNLFVASDIFINASIVETFCLAVQEAMACRTACVAFPVGGISAMIDHKVNGYLANPFDVVDFIEGLKYIAMNRERMMKMQDGARNKIIHNFGIKSVIEPCVQFYHDIINNEHKTC